MSIAPAPARSPSGTGLSHALGAYLLWAVLPLYFHAARAASPFEIVAWRTLFSVPLCLVLAAGLGQLGEVAAALRDRKRLGPLCLSAALIGGNWVVYVVAVAHGHVLAASLGYYINPLVNVVLGMVFLRERLRAMQWVAVGLAGVAVALLAWGARDMLWISLSLALTFAVYGLVRKLAPVAALPGLTVETVLLAPFALGYLAWAASAGHEIAFGREWGQSLLLALAGPITAVPLLLFAHAARRLDYSTLGFLQYLTPTIVFGLSVVVFREPLRPVQIGCFVAIWIAIGIYTRDLIVHRRAQG